MNVLHLVEYLNLGGIERLLEQIAGSSNANRAKQHFFTYETSELTGIGKSMKDSGYSVLTYKKSSGRDWKLVDLLIRTIKEKGIDVIHTHDFGPMEYAVILKIRFPRLKLVHTQHTLTHFVTQSKYKYFFQFASYFYNRIIAVSEHVKDSVLEACPRVKKSVLKVIPNGVDTTRFMPQTFIEGDVQNTPLTKLRLISVARISPVKNLEYLLNTCRLLSEANIPFEFHHAGTAKEKSIEKVYQQFILENNLQNDVTMHGFVNDATQILSKGDIFLSSSRSEGHPVALLEAMSSEKYCIVSDIAPHQETSHGSLEFYDIGRPEALFEILKNIYYNQPNLNVLAKKSREIVDSNYSLKKMVKSYVEQYNE